MSWDVCIDSRPSVMERGIPDYWRAAESLVTYILHNCEAGIISRRNE